MYVVNYFLKRFFDIFLSSFALIVFIPLFIAIALAIKLDSKGPVFFKQGRISKNGRVFDMIKFRSMVVNAEDMGTGLFNYAHDPRVTKVGLILRNTSLDELPQLINVAKGDMSLVGPRPPVTYELGDFDTLNARYKKRFSILPGITGLAQVAGRNCVNWDKKVNIDNQYIDMFRTQGLWLDIKILFKTVINVFARRDICEEKVDESLDDEAAAAAAEQAIIAKAHAIESDEVFCK